MADPDRTRRLLAESGWADISIIGHELPCSIGWPDSDGVEERLAMVLGTEVGPLMRDQVPSDEQPALIDKARASLRQRVVDGAVRLDASVWLVTAIRE